MVIHPANDATISDDCLTATGAADAILRYNTAFNMNDGDARLSEWMRVHQETVR